MLSDCNRDDQFVDRLRNLFLVPNAGMSVNICGQACLRVAGSTLNSINKSAHLQKKGDGGVSQIVEADIG